MKKFFTLKAVATLIVMLTASSAGAEVRSVNLSGTDCELYLQDKTSSPSPTVVILPGGGYVYHAIDHEGNQWVPFFTDRGFNVAILKYTFPKGDSSKPMNDVAATITSLRENASKWNLNPNQIGVMGFSAGGHLASTVATHFTGKDRPDFQILFYPVISMDPALTHQGSHDNFLGEDASVETEVLYSNEKQVTPQTPRAIIFHSNDDDLVVPMNSTGYYDALKRAGVSATLHIYPEGGHGWGFMETFPYHDIMLEELSVWLENLPVTQAQE